MTRNVLLLSGMALVFTTVHAGDPAKGDQEKLQGTWVVVKRLPEKQDGDVMLAKIVSITIKGNSIFFNGKEKKGKEFAFSIDPSKKPKTIDIKFAEDFGKKVPAGKIALGGIYLLDGDELKVAFMNMPKGTDRPTDFEGKDKSTTAVLKREKR